MAEQTDEAYLAQQVDALDRLIEDGQDSRLALEGLMRRVFDEGRRRARGATGTASAAPAALVAPKLSRCLVPDCHEPVLRCARHGAIWLVRQQVKAGVGLVHQAMLNQVLEWLGRWTGHESVDE